MSLEIKCINKTDRQNPHERIQNIGGIENNVRWRKSQIEGIQTTEAAALRNEVAYFVQSGGYRSNVIVKVSAAGHKYLTTTADGESQDNLLKQPECPPM